MAALRNRNARILAVVGSVACLGIGCVWFRALSWADLAVLATLPAAALLWAVHDHGYQKGRAEAARKQR
jgi:hypothetical protein